MTENITNLIRGQGGNNSAPGAHITKNDLVNSLSGTPDAMSLIPDNLCIDGIQPDALASNTDLLQEQLSRGESILLEKGLLYVATDGKVYFTPDAIKYYVQQAVIKTGSPEALLQKNINPFGFRCIDGRVKLPDNFSQLSSSEQLGIYPGAVPGGGVGVLMNMIIVLTDLYPNDDDVIKRTVYAILERNKLENPDNYKIQWHTDKHTEDHKHGNSGDFSCGCGFIMDTIKNPDKYGLSQKAISWVMDILNDSTWTDKADVLGDNHIYLEEHKERAAIVALPIPEADGIYENFILNKQVDFSPFLSSEEIETLSPIERDQLRQMAFTGSFRAFGIKASQIASMLVDIIMSDPSLLDKIQLQDHQKSWLASKNLFFVPQYLGQERMSEAAIHALMTHKFSSIVGNMTATIKDKLSPHSPLVTVRLNPQSGDPIITSIDVK